MSLSPFVSDLQYDSILPLEASRGLSPALWEVDVEMQVGVEKVYQGGTCEQPQEAAGLSGEPSRP